MADESKTVGQLVDEAAKLLGKGSRVRLANVLHNAGYEMDTPVEVLAARASMRVMRHWRGMGDRMYRAMTQALEAAGVTIPETREEPKRDVALTRHMVIDTLWRSLTATHPDRAAEIMAEVERWRSPVVARNASIRLGEFVIPIEVDESLPPDGYYFRR